MKNTDYVKLAAALGISSTGDGVRIVAMPLLAATLTQDPLQITMMVVVNRLPWVLFALSGGFLADRYSRRALMVGIDVMRGLLILAFSAGVLMGAAGIVLMAIVSFCLGIGETIFSAANQGMIPDVVEEADLGKANGFIYTLQSVAANFVGPALGGVLFSVGRWAPFALDAASFFGASALMSHVSTDGTPQSRLMDGMMKSIRIGLSWCLRRPVVIALLSVMAVMNFAQSAMQATLVLYVTQDLGLSAWWYGIVMSISGIGAVLGGLIAPMVDRRFGFDRVMRVAVAMAIPILVLILAIPSVWVLMAALFMNSLIGLLVSVMVATIRQKIAPRALAGRIASVQTFAAMGVALPFGALSGGVVASLFGVRAVFVFSVIVCCALSASTIRVLAPGRLRERIDSLVAAAEED
jgi:MFS family permease